MYKIPAKLRIAAVGIHNAGIVAGAIEILALAAFATLGHGLSDPSLRGLLIVFTILAVASSVAIELAVRAAHVAVDDGWLRWRLWEGWAAHGSAPIESISDVKALPGGDIEISFGGARKPLRLSARQFGRDDLTTLARVLSSPP